MTDSSQSHEFSEYRRLFLAELERAERERVQIRKELNSALLDIQQLKTQASIWGAGAGIIAGAVASVVVRGL